MGDFAGGRYRLTPLGLGFVELVKMVHAPELGNNDALERLQFRSTTKPSDEWRGGQYSLRDVVGFRPRSTHKFHTSLIRTPNATVTPCHPKAMSVILTRAEVWKAVLGGIHAEELQRPLPDSALGIVNEET